MNENENNQTGISVKITGGDGNIFAIMGKASKALEQAGFRDKASLMVSQATRTHSYEEAIAKISEFVDLY